MEAILYDQLNQIKKESLFYEDSNSYIIIGEGFFSVYGTKFQYDTQEQSPLDTLLHYLQKKNTTNVNYPCIVLIDLPSTAKSFKAFSNPESQKVYFPKSIFLWNASRLSIAEMNHLFETGAADDFFDNDFDIIKIASKVQFLIKFKQIYDRPNFLYQGDIHKIDYSYRGSFIFKRTFDIFLSVFFLLLLFPLFILVSIAIKIESRGPVFYVSNRVGRNYRIFPMIKFRSMYDGADLLLNEINHLNMYRKENLDAPFLKIKDDPRVSHVGKFLRKTSIDEFPQLINVLMGHMSVVGNRPLPLYEAEKLLTNKYVRRFDAPAGITGLWQVVKKRFPNMNEEDRIELDIQYSKEFSLLNDFWILLKTPGALLQNQNY
jgi:lipopolysaccharide/colanic/teichoic acid biosynthesis glycosyltransferase